MTHRTSFPILITLSLCVAALGCDDGKPATESAESSAAKPDPAGKAKSKKEPAGPTQPAAKKLAPGLAEGEIIVGDKVCDTCRGTLVAVTEGHPAYHRW